MKKILLTTINAKWIHPSLALRLLKANLGDLKEFCEITEFALRQPLNEKTVPILAAKPYILGISVSIWNHTATVELLNELDKTWKISPEEKPLVVLGGPEATHLPKESGIFIYADYVIRGEGEKAFRALCETLIGSSGAVRAKTPHGRGPEFITAENVNLKETRSAYHLYSDEDITKKLIYVEASRGCVFNCEFCLSSVKSESGEKENRVREFPLEEFFTLTDELAERGAKTFKFLDRSINTNIRRTIKICDFFLDKIEKREKNGGDPLVVHFEMVPSLFPPELIQALSRFPPGSLRLEIGIQTLNRETSARVNRRSNPELELETLRLLRGRTNAIIHADLIAGLPGEDLSSFGEGFDRLWSALNSGELACLDEHPRAEIQLGILKLLPGAPVFRHNEDWGMVYSPLPPYEVERTSVITGDDLKRLKNFARFWELLVNRGLIHISENIIFNKFIEISDKLLAKFGRNWGIEKKELLSSEILSRIEYIYRAGVNF